MSLHFPIVKPTFNRSASVVETFQSCFSQSYVDFEVVIVDDGSTEDTQAVLASIEDPRIIFVHQQNSGPADARNHGMRMAEGAFIAFLDSDNNGYPGFLYARPRLGACC